MGNMRPVGIDGDGCGVWEDVDTGERWNSGEPLTEDEARDVAIQGPTTAAPRTATA